MKKTIEVKKLYSIIKLLIISGLLIGVSSCQSGKNEKKLIVNKSYKKPIKESFELIKTYMYTSFSPGASISISHNNQLVWSQGFGYASKELKVPVNRETKFRIGNTSQMFTAFTIAKLQEQGKIDLKGSFYDYIKDYPRKQWDFSPYLLGVNSAGFYDNATDQLIKNEEVKSLKDYISYFENDSLVYKPNSYFQKSDYSFGLLGMLAEQVTGTYYQKLVQEIILDTLQLKSTTIDNPFLIIENRSDCYSQDYIARLVNAPKTDLRCIAPSIGFLSTSDDLNKAGQTILEPGFFNEESLSLFFTPNRLSTNIKTNRGFGWWVTADEYDRKIYIQLGSVSGGSSILMVYPEQKLVLSMCTNLKNEEIESTINKIARVFLNQIDPQETEEPETNQVEENIK
ncbi:serine hydrolase domain-containing protein [Sunxiuqinia sp. A32]|uniref:serine hydrolase domain-containing protein n=1 Tax=Sunxiuqinia sp. A32 TaxID=3461496 RepID=UPI004045F56A